MSVGLRLKEERKRLGLTQEAMGVACGVSKRTQIFYETDSVGASAAYLAAAHALGADVTFVLTGERERLSAEDSELLELWRAAKPPARAAAIATLTKDEAHSSSVAAAPRTQFTDATIGQQFSGDVDLTGQKLVIKAPRVRKKAAH
ncbi:helix-turn-helix domain-containing protein [Stenotrophomonas rhizophila]|uniref:helix-turn-helix domain-containing protein n=1 Tax=Stenotrophomonas rhizophila TaxID=216778 RepID=UPI003517372C